ncbi:hypothetical protein F3Y22_tig00002237pilonHSYRG00890 [Hibiscus syriacus]|uniref:Uncharacterized protein n=1 Tax=Hibiscus syriacus TaxID=106335 RepID=A0A6A3CY71_HIBSY|nr:hypothetical protein F3Y22_tig00002237pilonHSYRG00890 [Hibiscus syriacus]
MSNELVSHSTGSLWHPKSTDSPGSDTVCVFPKNGAKGESPMNIICFFKILQCRVKALSHASSHVYMALNNAIVPSSVQATFPYIFAVSKYLQPGTFDLVGMMIYDIALSRRS